VLAVRLVEIYKAGRPDLISLVLKSSDFSDLLERAELLRRISDQDARVVNAVGDARDQTRAATVRLAGLQTAAQRVAASIKTRRDRVAGLQGTLSRHRSSLSAARSGKQRLLSSVRADRRELQSQLAALERENTRVQATLARAAQPPSTSAGAPPTPEPSSSGLIWPVTGTITSPFGPRWGRLHAGIDIAAPEGTPIKAAAAGTVVIAGWQGGYGNYTCVQHAGALSTCYAHQSQIATSNGATVTQGQVIGYVGNTGASFGAHLHFETRTSGTPVDPFGYL
jgi:murein DD-endopeptidase MepM/ murein hydrolase activator NlpD